MACPTRDLLRVSEVKLSNHLEIALALGTSDLTEEGRGNGLRGGTGERRVVDQAIRVATEHEVFLLGDVELLAQRKVELAQPGSTNDTRTGVAEGAGGR